jgi:succinylglutamic semialdehyde dehydrogenase
MQSKQRHFINGQWQASNGAPFDSVNPATGEVLWSGHTAGEREVEQAVQAARAAFPSWSLLPYRQRKDFVTRFIEQLQTHSDQLAESLHLETGKPLWESRTEIGTMVAKATASDQAYHSRTGESVNENAGVSMALSHRAIGVFAVLGPYNFPGHLPNGHIIPALLAGNTIVFKPSELTPQFADLMVQCWQQAGLPPGVINLVQGDGKTGELLGANDGLDGVLFTGSSRTGHAIHKQFGGRPEKMLALEMGGNNPLVVNKVGDHAAAVYTIVQSAFITAGQRCTCARRLVLVKSSDNEALLASLVETSRVLRVGTADDCFMGPVISNRAADMVLDFERSLLSSGGRSLLAVDRPQPDRPFLSPGIIDVSDSLNIVDEECFGPLLQVIWVDDFDAAIAEANNTRYGLSAGLLSDDDADWHYFLPRVRAGIINFNRPTTGASGAAPFGGVGASGNFRPSAFYAADYCAYPVASVAAGSLELPANLPPGIKL